MASAKKVRIVRSIAFPKLILKPNFGQSRQRAKGAISKGMMNSRNIIKTSLSEALQRSLKTSVWAWPRSTVRQSGGTAGSPRDIFDTGKLSRSQKVVTNYSGGSLMVNIKYSAPYASIVHYGGTHRPYGDESRPLQLLPARPWIYATVTGTYGITKYDMKSHLETAIKNEWLARFNAY